MSEEQLPIIMTSGKLELPVLPLRDVVVYPNMVIPLFVGRQRSIRALEASMVADKQVFLVAQKNSERDDPKEKDLYLYGTVATVLQLLKLPDGTVKVLVEGLQRGHVSQYKMVDDYIVAEVEVVEQSSDGGRQIEIYRAPCSRSLSNMLN